jgi:hypothetical protein
VDEGGRGWGGQCGNKGGHDEQQEGTHAGDEVVSSVRCEISLDGFGLVWAIAIVDAPRFLTLAI